MSEKILDYEEKNEPFATIELEHQWQFILLSIVAVAGTIFLALLSVAIIVDLFNFCRPYLASIMNYLLGEYLAESITETSTS